MNKKNSRFVIVSAFLTAGVVLVYKYLFSFNAPTYLNSPSTYLTLPSTYLTSPSTFLSSPTTNFGKNEIKQETRQTKKTELNLNGKYNQIVALVFYGRREYIQILSKYLIVNMKSNGGVLDKVIFAVRTGVEDDLTYLDSLLKKHPEFFVKQTFSSSNPTYTELYTKLNDNDLVFKIDDDVLFISNGTFHAMIEEYLKNNHLFLSANVVNHRILSDMHARIGALKPYPQVAKGLWVKNESRQDEIEECSKFTMENKEKRLIANWHTLPKCGIYSHESFLENYEKNRLDVYDFRYYDFHAMSYLRWNINFILFKSNYANKIHFEAAHHDDEERISVELPRDRKIHCYALGKALVAHFAFYTQRDFIIENTNLLNRYYNLSISYLGF